MAPIQLNLSWKLVFLFLHVSMVPLQLNLPSFKAWVFLKAETSSSVVASKKKKNHLRWFYCTACISGGHINPTVTFGLLLTRKLSVTRAVFYMIMQCLGAICGAGVVKGFQPSKYQMLNGGANFVSPGYTKGDGLGAEIVGTFVLVYTVFSATDAKRNARDSHVHILAPLPIGFAVFLVHLATIPITENGINPARSLGAAIIYNRGHAWDDHWIFWVGPFIGSALAAMYHVIVIRAIPFKSSNKC
ncbi:hypothetical protein MKX03_036140 [Papaver bracteatum]|nr:hypothetical protein MKX03_036140 [Papaver bracteatum]